MSRTAATMRSRACSMASAALLRVAASRFAALRLALNEVSDTLLFPHGNSPERLMRQVRAEAAWRWVS